MILKSNEGSCDNHNQLTHYFLISKQLFYFELYEIYFVKKLNFILVYKRQNKIHNQDGPLY